jgi:anaerobic magnesium-protoporphyrin IX monomethyl ester cyclase
MDLILIHPAIISDTISEHLGLASLKAFLTQYGFKVDVLDMVLENLDIPAVIQILQQLQPGCIGISMLDQTKEHGLALIQQIRQAGFRGPLIAGGYFPTFHADVLLKNVPAIDYIVRGEGEYTLLDLMYFLSGRGNKPLAGISGISYHINGQLWHNPPRPLIYDLDSLPMVDRKYAAKLIKKTGHLRVYASRGCWGNCSFCDINSFYTSSPGKKWRSRSIIKFVDELEHLVKTYHCDYFILNDDNFLTRGLHNRQRAENLAAELARRNLSLSFELMCRVDSIDRQALLPLKRSGLRRVFLGIESFDQNQLNRFGKGTTVRQNLKALVILKRLKIDCIVSVILADAYTRLRDLIKQYFVLFLVQKKYFNSKNCKISINERLELYRGSSSYQQYKQAGLLTSDHWYDGYDFRLKKLTAGRLKLARLENKIFRKISGWKKNNANRFRFRPGPVLKNELSSQLLKISKN